MTAASIAALVVAAAGVVAASLRWLRVAQREHYLAGSTVRFALRWWGSDPTDAALAALACAGVIGAGFAPAAAVVPGVVAILAPRKLAIRGRTSRLSWTRRLATLAVALCVIDAALVVAGALAAGLRGASFVTALLCLGNAALLDVALFAMTPIEEMAAARYVRQASERLAKVKPTVVAVTGSYGKTTTKGYISHLVSHMFDTVASPQSYNNRAGLCRTVNEHVRPSTQVVVAEMGAYGPGEIASLCRWMTPDISVITAIGPAHLERFKSLDRTLEAKAEITARARVAVLNVDDERLAGLAGRLAASGKKVVTASGTSGSAGVSVLRVPDGMEVRVAGRRIGVAVLSGGGVPTALSNVACAVAVALELGVAPEAVLPRLAGLPVAPNRLQRYVAGGGYVVLDDTFNSNPRGASIALQRLAQEGPAGRRAVITPGMVELGSRQYEENASFAEAAVRLGASIVAVARTNRRALRDGAARAEASGAVVSVDRLDEAVAWAKANLGPGDAVLYENDLPDHFP